jgi:hypothetical protein
MKNHHTIIYISPFLLTILLLTAALPLPAQTSRTSPANAAKVSARGEHTLMIDTDGGLWAWGKNQYGQLGNGSSIDRLLPVPVKAGTRFTAVSAQGYSIPSLSLVP